MYRQYANLKCKDATEPALSRIYLQHIGTGTSFVCQLSRFFTSRFFTTICIILIFAIFLYVKRHREIQRFIFIHFVLKSFMLLPLLIFDYIISKPSWNKYLFLFNYNITSFLSVVMLFSLSYVLYLLFLLVICVSASAFFILLSRKTTSKLQQNFLFQ